MVPCVVVGVLDWLFRRPLGDLVNQPGIPLYYVPFFSYKRLWFLQALFVLFLVAPIFPRSPRQMAAVVGGVYLLSMVFQPQTELLSIDDVVRMAPHFAFGYNLGLLGDRPCTWRAGLATQLLVAMAAIGLTYVHLQIESQQLFGSPRWLRVIMYRLVPTVNILFIWVMVTRYIGSGRGAFWRGWAAAGTESMAIYLYHVPAMMPVRVMLSGVSGTAPLVASVVLATVIGVIVPMALSQFVLSRVPILNAALLGAPLKRRQL